MGIYNIGKVLLLYTFCDIILSKKISLPDLDNLSSSKINECQRCKVLIESFNHWLDKTSRGKFEGGDAAWEESKLKSYARSEIRLVEVQEGLCSELKKHQDHCYSLAEEAEQAIEKWWFQEDPNSIDLHSWLCIETLQHCCPQNHYGETCAPCPLDKNNKVCGDNGKCNGEGTRKGNGSCLCKRGFAGTFCAECDKNYYMASGECEPCHKACNGCSGGGAAACDACKDGWQLVSGVCEDIDECSDPSSCKINQFCVNKEGSHVCRECDKSCKTCEGKGPSNCTSCEPNHSFWSGVCLDDQSKHELLTNTLKRVALYCGLLIISLFIFRNYRILASLVVIIIAVYIYFSEQSSKINVVDVFRNIYF